jgi:hypothetical protein
VVEGESLAAVEDLVGCDDLRLVGEFDAYLLGYQDRRYALADEHRKHVHPGGGMLRPAVIQGGVVIGSWKHNGLQVELFDDSSREPEGLAAELEDLARFRG